MNFCALDLGAESGRVMLGHFDGSTVSIEEAHRFDSAPVLLPDGLHTDVLHIWSELKTGLAKAVRIAGGTMAGIGVDTWGVDFALLDKNMMLLGNPHHYRDTLTDGILEKAFSIVDQKRIYEFTGLQFMPINTLFQLLALKFRGERMLDVADKLLMMPDLFNFWLSGRIANEYTIATTSQCFDPREGTWARPLIAQFGLPEHLFGEIVQPATVFAPLMPYIAREIGVGNGTRIIAPGCHDTALAVAAVPAKDNNFAYISCGTWSLLGTELTSPCINEKSLAADFTNEGGVNGTIRFQKSLTGLWILQECRRQWEREGKAFTYEDLAAEASKTSPLCSLIDPAMPQFARPGNLSQHIIEFCRQTGQPIPDGVGAITRCILESLALSYRRSIDEMEKILGRRFAAVHMVGGGTKNRLLCQFAANATNHEVMAGPVEATAIGSICMQAIALGCIESLPKARSVIRASFPTTTYVPAECDQWDEAFNRFSHLA